MQNHYVSLFIHCFLSFCHCVRIEIQLSVISIGFIFCSWSRFLSSPRTWATCSVAGAHAAGGGGGGGGGEASSSCCFPQAAQAASCCSQLSAARAQRGSDSGSLAAARGQGSENLQQIGDSCHDTATSSMCSMCSSFFVFAVCIMSTTICLMILLID